MGTRVLTDREKKILKRTRSVNIGDIIAGKKGWTFNKLEFWLILTGKGQF